MGKNFFKYIRDQYVIKQVQNAPIPVFQADRICRCRITFSGRVQHVGFRLETSELARKLELTGFCQNLPNGDVLAELQGPENKIRFLTAFMESLKRISIRSKTIEEISLLSGESGFVQK